MNVPMVSKVSDIENAKIVTRHERELGRVGEQSRESLRRRRLRTKVCGSWEKVSEIDTESAIEVTPNGMPTTVVMAMASSRPPLTLEHGEGDWRARGR